MRKIGLIIILMCITLTGCSLSKKDEQKITSKTFNVYDISDEYTVSDGSLDLYYGLKKDIPYVDVLEYLHAIKDAILDTVKVDEKNSMLNISYEVAIEDELKQFVNEDSSKYTLSINFDKGTLKMNSIDFISSINKETETNFFEGLKYVGYTYTDPKEVSMDLSKYDIKIVYDEASNKYYIPFYLANFLFSGYGLETYFNEKAIYAFDVYSDYYNNKDLFNNPDTLNKGNSISSAMKEETYNYLAFLFDYTYGLKDLRGVDSYYDVLNTFKIKSASNDNVFYNEINRFINGLNDLHSSFIVSGYQEAYEQKTFSSRIYNYFSSFVSNQCTYDNKQQVTYSELDSNTGYIEIFGFDETVKSLVEEAMNKFSDKSNIVFDIRCNGGGVLGTIYHPLKYMTPDGIPFSMGSPFDSAFATTFTQADKSFFVPKNYYVVTSPVTFSAANAFTSIVKDNNYATVIGTKSGGGAAAVLSTILPDGSIINISGPNVIYNSKNEVIEDGIDVDIEMDINDKTDIKEAILKVIRQTVE